MIGSLTRGEQVKHDASSQNYPYREHPVYLLWHPETARLQCIMIGEITEKRIGFSSLMALRTAATSGVGFRHLVRKDATTAGVYGVMSYAAAQRQAEMGVRIALGASRADVLSILVGSGARLAAIGLACGLVIALVAGRLIESMLYEIRPGDPLAIGGAVLMLSGAALLAALIPALRASRIDPAIALREE